MGVAQARRLPDTEANALRKKRDEKERVIKISNTCRIICGRSMITTLDDDNKEVARDVSYSITIETNGRTKTFRFRENPFNGILGKEGGNPRGFTQVHLIEIGVICDTPELFAGKDGEEGLLNKVYGIVKSGNAEQIGNKNMVDFLHDTKEEKNKGKGLNLVDHPKNNVKTKDYK